MRLIFLILVSTILVAGSTSERLTFDGYRLLRVFPQTDKHFEYLNSLETIDTDFDIWGGHHGSHIDVLLSPNSFAKYSQLFRTNGISFDILDENIQNKIDQESISMAKTKSQIGSSRNIIFKYARYSEIKSFVDTTVANNPDLASSYLAGTTVQNRDIQVIVLKTPTSSRSVWIDCGIHAREWVSPSTCVFIIDSLIKEYRNGDSKVTSLLNKYEFHILPLLNPDGYEYSQTTYRLWRKNRSPNAGSSCIGTDLNRNFGYRWLTGGSSTNPCSDTYAGNQANSELETKAVIKAINDKTGQWDAFLSIHSYGQWWLTPYGHSTLDSELPPDYADLVAKAKVGADAIKSFNGTVFTIGSSAQLLYVNTGSSKDYMYAVENIKYSYVLELRPGSGTPDASFGFLLPEDRMPLVATETYVGIKEHILAVSNSF